jgi:hypothetical protein
MARIVIEAYLTLLYLDLHICFGDLKSIHRFVQTRKVDPKNKRTSAVADRLCHAMDVACAFYPKQVLCLQRSAATTWLLRCYGFRATMVIGAQLLPFKSHAWVEIDGIVVNDRPYMSEIYQVLERC